MVQKVHIVLEDDIDGGEAAETVTFGLDGSSYEIDLSETHAEAIRKALEPFVNAARKVAGKGHRTRVSRGSVSNGHSAREIRDWARSHGQEVPERGRIPAEVRERFELAVK